MALGDIQHARELLQTAEGRLSMVSSVDRIRLQTDIARVWVMIAQADR